MSALLEAASLLPGALLDAFGYHRSNFLYDRRQRQVMEYELAGMRVKQTGLWREDVRDSIQLAQRKMTVYLLVIALELNAVATALCKARLAPGVPPWLAACHTLAMCGSLTYLLLGLWFGLQAFVAAQAYKVRILTQLVRLPVPSWAALEACRTYAASAEHLGARQLLRPPLVTGHAPHPGGTGPGRVAADPWGLEPRADLPELRPEVNRQVERQRHIWLVRESARFYQTYDAFCRVSLSAGTGSLAQFFGFFCLSYVHTENAAPMAAWAGTIIFNGISIMLIKSDLTLSGRQYLLTFLLLVSSPALCAAVAFVSSRHSGDAGVWEFLMPVALFLRGAWFVHYLWLFRVKELQSATMLPTAFGAVLFTDPFAWARRLARPRPVEPCPGSRPEALSPGPAPAAVPLRPATFYGQETPEAQTGADIHGERPGLVPWRYFLLNTFFLALMWWSAAFVALLDAAKGSPDLVRPIYGLQPGIVARMPVLHGGKVETGWWQPLARPRGLACGSGLLVTSGFQGGREVLLLGRLPRGAGVLRFVPAPCPLLGEDSVRDLALGCAGRCALVLPSRGQRLVQCPLVGNATPAALPLGRLWLDDRSEGLLPEEFASLAPCAEGREGCVVVGTTGRRLVQLAARQGPRQSWEPGHLVMQDHGSVPSPGSFMFFSGGYLGALDRAAGLLRATDPSRGGRLVGTWALPPPSDGAKRWASICVGGDALYALEDREGPGLWRFDAPAELRAKTAP